MVSNFNDSPFLFPDTISCGGIYTPPHRNRSVSKQFPVIQKLSMLVGEKLFIESMGYPDRFPLKNTAWK